ncbi:YqgE/AlgH family protein [Fretibacter rubidus]|uniref:YqgE/AlgH family protein n=1 Tax=Fretibacter rubidus TaxID=570162 RepID=UPI00352AC68D
MIKTTNLTGKFLIATPAMEDPRFSQAVIYVCNHDDDGAMGLTVNKTKGALNLSEMLDQIGIDGAVRVANSPVLNGGPVDMNRGFVIHSPDYSHDNNSLRLSDTLMMTSTKDVLEALVADNAPKRAVMAVGYSGWSAGQLEQELAVNAWLVVDGEDALIFDTDMDSKWTRALAGMGISPEQLSTGGQA